MPTFVFTYRIPTRYVPSRPENLTAWTAWSESMGENLADIGNPVSESAALGNCGAGTRLGGYSFVTADDLELAIALAKHSQALDAGGGAEVDVVTWYSSRRSLCCMVLGYLPLVVAGPGAVLLAASPV